MTHARHPYLHFAYGLPFTCYYAGNVTLIGLCFELDAQYPPTRIAKVPHTSGMLHLHMRVRPLPQWHGATQNALSTEALPNRGTHTEQHHLY